MSTKPRPPMYFLRKNRGLTQIEVANALGTSTYHISMWETGKMTPSVPWLKRLSAFYNVTIDELVE